MIYFAIITIFIIICLVFLLIEISALASGNVIIEIESDEIIKKKKKEFLSECGPSLSALLMLFFCFCSKQK